MRAGRNRILMTIERNAGSAADFGEGYDKWEPFRVAWVDLIPVRQDERVELSKTVPITTHQIKMRIDPAQPITTEHRGAIASRVFAFRQVIDVDERGAEYLILADEVS